MGACRESANIWWCLTHKYGWGRLWGKHSVWTSGHLWHDSFGVFLNRYVKCKLFNHKNVKDISDNRNYVELHCFDCEKKVEPLPLFFGTDPPPPEIEVYQGIAGGSSFRSTETNGITFGGDLDKTVFTDGKRKITAKEILNIKTYLQSAVAAIAMTALLILTFSLVR